MRRLLLIALVVICVACTAAPAQPIAPAPTPLPAVTSAPTATASASAPALPSVDLSPYRAAMKSDFAAEVDRFGDVPQYQIDLEIAPDLMSYSARQQVRYTNQEEVPLPDLRFQPTRQSAVLWWANRSAFNKNRWTRCESKARPRRHVYAPDAARADAAR